MPKKSVFTRLFGVFCFLGECSRCPAPKPPALSTAPRPDVLNYTTNALFLQVVKSVVKTFCRCFFEKGNIRKSQCLQGRFLNDCKAFRGFAFRAERVFARGGVPAACMLPNVARYQLRRISPQYRILAFTCFWLFPNRLRKQ